jgi:hypothetical protein
MVYHLVSADAFAELGILEEKAEAALRCIKDDSKCQRAQTLADIANDYLSAMHEMIEAMQKSGCAIPQRA